MSSLRFLIKTRFPSIAEVADKLKLTKKEKQNVFRNLEVSGLASFTKRAPTRKPKARKVTLRTPADLALFKALPAAFSLEHIALKKKPRAYLRQFVVRWAKEGKIKKAGPQKYLKTRV